MASPAHGSDRTLAAARETLVRQRRGGRRSIGRGSARLRSRHRRAKLARVAVAVAAIIAASMVAGMIVDGIGFEGLMLTVLAIVAAAVLLARYPRLKPPPRETLNQGDVRTMVARTELWLEAQRPALPAPAVELVDRLGVQLDALGLQLEGIGRDQPAAVEVRKLVGEHLPAMVESYRRIPGHLRGEQRGGRTPDQELAEGLGRISQEIDQVTRQLAAGDIDNLAIRGRYLDYRYGAALEDQSRGPAEGAA